MKKEAKKEDKGYNSKDRFRKNRIKVCALCKDKELKLDYKDAEGLKRFINEKGKILPRRVTGTCSKHQRVITEYVKRARTIAILPYSVD